MVIALLAGMLTSGLSPRVAPAAEAVPVAAHNLPSEFVPVAAVDSAGSPLVEFGSGSISSSGRISMIRPTRGDPVPDDVHGGSAAPLPQSSVLGALVQVSAAPSPARSTTRTFCS